MSKLEEPKALVALDHRMRDNEVETMVILGQFPVKYSSLPSTLIARPPTPASHRT